MGYVLIHQPTGHTVRDVTDEEVRLFKKLLPPNQILDWCLQFNGLVYALHDAPGLKSFEAPSGSLTIDVNSFEKRTKSRFRKVITFEGINDNEVFHSETLDLNIQGLQLQSPLPAHFPKKFLGRLLHAGRAVDIVIRRINGTSSTKFSIDEISNRELLVSWLLR